MESKVIKQAPAVQNNGDTSRDFNVLLAFFSSSRLYSVEMWEGDDFLYGADFVEKEDAEEEFDTVCCNPEWFL